MTKALLNCVMQGFGRIYLIFNNDVRLTGPFDNMITDCNCTE